MIFNLSQGGVAYISVTSPSGAAITATCQGLTVTGSGTCALEAPVIGTWVVTCIFNGAQKVQNVEVTSFGETYTAAFDYNATIGVTTHPGASVVATKSGQTSLSGTASEGGVCILTVPAGGLGTWNVTATNTSSVSDSADVDVAAYDTRYTVSLLPLVPIISVTIGDNTYNYNGAEIDETGIKISPIGITGWKFWMTTSGSVTFSYLPTNIDTCIIGKGGNGGGSWGSNGYYGGGGGGGGGAVNRYTLSLNAGIGHPVTTAVTIDCTGSYFGTLASAGNGQNGGGPSGGNSGGGSADGNTGQWVNDHSYPPSSGGSSSAVAGVYAYGESDFDGVRYANGGGGGAHSGGGGGSYYTTPGSGGAGGGNPYSGGRTLGITGILIMRNAT